MLYVYSENGGEYISFRNRDEINSYCENQPGATLSDCRKAFHTLEIVGFISFALICVSLGLQIYDLVRMRRLLNYVNKNSRVKSKLKGRLIYSLIISSQMVALLLYLFTLICLKGLVDFSISHCGISYWMSAICNTMSIVFAIYYRW
jgi:hypothetical protein